MLDSLAYFMSALFATAVPLYLYTSIFGLNIAAQPELFGSVTLVSAIVLTFAYRNVAYAIELRLQNSRSGQINGGKKLTKAEKKAVQDGQASVTAAEASAFSILYNNAVYLLALVLLAFMVFSGLSPEYNYVLSATLPSVFLSYSSVTDLRKRF